MEYVVQFAGHSNIRSLHRTTIEITTEASLTPRGDCIVGVSASSGCAGIPTHIKAALRDMDHTIQIILQVGSREFIITGRGSPDLVLSHPHDIVLRKSRFICPRTLAIGCDMASLDIPRSMIQDLQKGMDGTLTIVV